MTAITLGVSACLLGEPVRFNGNHKLSQYLRDVLGEYFVLEQVCPEVAIGLGTPRPPIRLLATDAGVVVRNSADKGSDQRDHAPALRDYGEQLSARNTHWCGFIGAAKSPSCGSGRVKVYDERGVVTRHADGVVVQAIKAINPLLPVEDEGRLHDAALRENFLLRVHVYAGWRNEVAAGITAKSLVAWWSRHKFLVLSHNQKIYRDIGPMLANLKQDVALHAQRVFEQVMLALAKPATRSNHINALQHLGGFLKQAMTEGDRQEWNALLADYGAGYVPLSVPLALLNHHVRCHGNEYVRAQQYLMPYPAALGLRNSVV